MFADQRVSEPSCASMDPSCSKYATINASASGPSETKTRRASSGSRSRTSNPASVMFLTHLSAVVCGTLHARHRLDVDTGHCSSFAAVKFNNMSHAGSANQSAEKKR